MSENTTPNTEVKTPAKAKKAESLKAAKKVVKPVAAKKEKAKVGPRAKKEGLRAPQIRILAALAKNNHLTRAQLAEKAPVDVAACVEYLGSHNDDVRKANDVKHFPSLRTLGYVKLEVHESSDGRDSFQYVITASGRKAYEKAIK